MHTTLTLGSPAITKFPSVPNVKYLDLIFDKMLTWVQYIKSKRFNLNLRLLKNLINNNNNIQISTKLII